MKQNSRKQTVMANNLQLQFILYFKAALTLGIMDSQIFYFTNHFNRKNVF